MIPNTVPVEDTLQTMYPGYEGPEAWTIQVVDGSPGYVEIDGWFVPGEPQPTDQEIIDNAEEGTKATNEAKAREARETSTAVVVEDDMRTAAGLSRRIDDDLRADHLAYIDEMDSAVDNPPTEEWEPPLPPGVEIPATWSFKLTITRVTGWQGALGWRAVMTDWVEGHFPANASLSLYSGANCTGFLYTPGAFVQEGEDWVINCPAGQEPGDVDVHFGVTYSGVDVECKTLPQGQQSMVWDVNT